MKPRRTVHACIALFFLITTSLTTSIFAGNKDSLEKAIESWYDDINTIDTPSCSPTNNKYYAPTRLTRSIGLTNINQLEAPSHNLENLEELSKSKDLHIYIEAQSDDAECECMPKVKRICTNHLTNMVSETASAPHFPFKRIVTLVLTVPALIMCFLQRGAQ